MSTDPFIVLLELRLFMFVDHDSKRIFRIVTCTIAVRIAHIPFEISLASCRLRLPRSGEMVDASFCEHLGLAKLNCSVISRLHLLDVDTDYASKADVVADVQTVMEEFVIENLLK